MVAGVSGVVLAVAMLAVANQRGALLFPNPWFGLLSVLSFTMAMGFGGTTIALTVLRLRPYWVWAFVALGVTGSIVLSVQQLFSPFDDMFSSFYDMFGIEATVYAGAGIWIGLAGLLLALVLAGRRMVYSNRIVYLLLSAWPLCAWALFSNSQYLHLILQSFPFVVALIMPREIRNGSVVSWPAHVFSGFVLGFLAVGTAYAWPFFMSIFSLIAGVIVGLIVRLFTGGSA